MKRLGKNERHALEFAKKYKGWHSFHTGHRGTREAIKSLARKGLIVVNEFEQFALK